MAKDTQREDIGGQEVTHVVLELLFVALCPTALALEHVGPTYHCHYSIAEGPPFGKSLLLLLPFFANLPVGFFRHRSSVVVFALNVRLAAYLLLSSEATMNVERVSGGAIGVGGRQRVSTCKTAQFFSFFGILHSVYSKAHSVYLFVCLFVAYCTQPRVDAGYRACMHVCVECAQGVIVNKLCTPYLCLSPAPSLYLRVSTVGAFFCGHCIVVETIVIVT